MVRAFGRKQNNCFAKFSLAKQKSMGSAIALRSLRKAISARYLHLKEDTKAEPVTRETLETERRILGPVHSDMIVTLDVLAQGFRNGKRYAESEKI